MHLFSEIGILIAAATTMAVFMRILGQPLIIGHIITGLAFGPFLAAFVNSAETLKLMSEIGVAVLLYSVGLHLSPTIIRQFGKVAFITGFGQVIFTSVVGYFVCTWLGFPPLTAFYVAVALSFSSTIIVMKLINDRGDIDALYAKIAIGFLLVQDLIAVLLLLGIPFFAEGDATVLSIARFILIGVLLIAFVFLTTRLFSHVSGFISRSQEFLFIFAIAWGIGVAGLFQEFGFSPESGALIAGVSLASFPARHEITARLSPLRDFFILIFFILLGSKIAPADIVTMAPLALVLSLFVLISNPLILMMITGWLGYLRRTSFQAGLVISQISEFSLILIAVGVGLQYLDSSILSLVTMVGLFTIFGSTYLVSYSDSLYRVLEPALGIFERAQPREAGDEPRRYRFVLFGCNRIGFELAHTLKKLGESLLVIDHNPETIEMLKRLGIKARYGDARTYDLLDSIDFSRTELVVSTISSKETATLINRAVRAQNADAVVIVVAEHIPDAVMHYDQDVDYVILPHILSGEHAAELMLEFQGDRAKYRDLRDEHLKYLRLRIALGQDKAPSQESV